MGFNNTVYVSACLRKRYPNVYLGILSACKSSEIEFGVAEHTNNIWIRDFFPVQVNDHFVKFRYKSGLLTYDMKKYPQLRVTAKSFEWLLKDTIFSEIVLDGGNCVRGVNKFFITDIIFKHNPKYRKITLLNKLERILQGEIILIPAEPYDDLGHSDGILKPISDNEVFVNDYSVMKGKVYARYYNKLINCLVNHKIDCIPFPYAYNKQPKITENQFRKKYPEADDFNPATGYFINHLIVGKLIIMPVFKIEEDEKAFKMLQKWYPNFKIVRIDCSDLSQEGGLINCVTWECN